MQPDPPADHEVDDLVAALRSYGVLTREGLLESSGASHWVEHSFEAALRRGVERGSIRQLGDGLFELGPDAPEVSYGRFDPS